MDNYMLDVKNLTPWEQNAQTHKINENILMKFYQKKNSNTFSQNKSRLMNPSQNFTQMILKRKDNILKKLEQKSKKQIQPILTSNFPHSESAHKIIELKEMFPNYSLQHLNKRHVFNKSRLYTDFQPQQQNSVTFQRRQIQSKIKRSRTKKLFDKNNSFQKLQKIITLQSKSQQAKQDAKQKMKKKIIHNADYYTQKDSQLLQVIKYRQKSKEKSWEQRFKRIKTQLQRYSATECYKSKRNAFIALPKIQLIELKDILPK